MKKWILGLSVLLPLFLCCHAQETPQDEEDMRKEMMDKTKKAIMSYDIVEQRANELLERVQNSAFGDYAEKFAAAIPFVTGKLEFKYKNLDVSYSHFSDKAKVDYRLNKRWKLFYNQDRGDEGSDERSGLQYSRRF